jgi:hypothetical protein
MMQNNSHDASGQLTGYLYQILMALLSLLENTDNEAQICLEKFDDIAFIEDDEPLFLIQTKHHLRKKGDLSNTSVDLWRTINSWCDSIKKSPSGLIITKFLIITTASIQDDTAASFLLNTNIRNTKRALEILCNTANTSRSKTNNDYYENFLSMPSAQQQHLIDNTFIYANSYSIEEIKPAMMRFVRCATINQFEERVYDKLIGWWFKEIIKCLISTELIFINRMQIQNVLYDIASEYQVDSLPIDVDFTKNPTNSELNQISPNNRIFIEQLKLIMLSDSRIKRCIRDYYNAFRQRSVWVREQLLLVNELSDYETLLIDEWNRLFLIMQENLEERKKNSNEKTKTDAGKKLLTDIENMNINIREKVNKPFVMRGTYHDLANQLKVGWHIDFMNRLCHLLQE